MRISAVGPMDFAAERNTVPLPTGPSLTLPARIIIRGLYRGSFRWSAAKSNTASAGRPMMIALGAVIVLGAIMAILGNTTRVVN